MKESQINKTQFLQEPMDYWGRETCTWLVQFLQMLWWATVAQRWERPILIRGIYRILVENITALNVQGPTRKTENILSKENGVSYCKSLTQEWVVLKHGPQVLWPFSHWGMCPCHPPTPRRQPCLNLGELVTVSVNRVGGVWCCVTSEARTQKGASAWS